MTIPVAEIPITDTYEDVKRRIYQTDSSCSQQSPKITYDEKIKKKISKTSDQPKRYGKAHQKNYIYFT